MFLGPAPRHFFRQLRAEADKEQRMWKHCLPAWVRMCEVVNREYSCNLDMYTYQALPCFWIHFVASCKRCSLLGAPSDQKTAHRIMAERLFELEGLRYCDVRDMLGARLLPDVVGANLQAQRTPEANEDVLEGKVRSRLRPTW